MKRFTYTCFGSLLVLGTVASEVLADCPMAHTHIGINPTWRPDWSDPGNPAKATDPDTSDDNKLWFFSLPPVHSAATPGWPEWQAAGGTPFLLLTPDAGPGGIPILNPDDTSEKRYTCQFMYSKADGYGDPNGVEHLDGWHSAHGPQGVWNLADTADPGTPPLWDIYLQRVAVSANLDEDDFFMLLPNGSPVLTEDGQEYQLDKEWLDDEGAWGLHEHMKFYFWLPADGSAEGTTTVSATFAARDAGGLYDPSDDFTIPFRVVPEPGTLSLLGVSTLALARRRSRR